MMKKAIKTILLLLVLTIPVLCYSQWADVTFDTTNFYRSVKFRNQNDGLIVGDSGIIFKTSDGGNSWNNISYPFNDNLLDFQYINDTLIYAYSNRIIKSENSGNTWDSSFYLPAATAKVNFLSQSMGFAAGADGIFKSINAGLSWLSVWNYAVGSYGYGSIKDVKFINDSVGFASGTKHISGGGIYGIILKTTDTGITWNIVYENPPYGSGINKIEIIENSVYALLSSCNLLKSTDTGNTWTDLNINIEPYGEINSFYFKNNDTAYAVSSPIVLTPEFCMSKRKIFRTVDGWQTWITQYLEVPFLCQEDLLNSIYFCSDSTGFAVGYKKVLKTNNFGGNINISDTITYTEIHNIQDENNSNINIYPNPSEGTFSLAFKDNIQYQIEIYNYIGEKVYVSEINSHSSTINLNAPNGIYFIHLTEDNKIIATEKLIIVN